MGGHVRSAGGILHCDFFVPLLRRYMKMTEARRCLLLLLSLPLTCFAERDDFFEIDSPDQVSVGVVRTGGSAVVSAIFCVASADTDSRRPRNRDEVYPYSLRIDPYVGQEFVLFSSGRWWGSDETVPVQISHRDILDATGYERLTPGAWESHGHRGQFRDCRENGENSELRFEIDLTGQAGVAPGNYGAYFRLSGYGGSSGNQMDAAWLYIEATVEDVGARVRVSRLDDLLLGRYSGFGGLDATESFCVFSSVESYRISISGNGNQGDTFFVEEDQSGERIPMTVQFADNALGVGGTEVTGMPLTGSGDSRSEDCGGADNAALTVSLTEADLRAASSGNYTETLTLLVEPE